MTASDSSTPSSPADFDTTALQVAVENELRSAVRSLREETSSEHLYAVVVGLVEDLTGFFVAGQTVERAAKVKAKRTERPYYWWSPSEWPLDFADLPSEPKYSVTDQVWALTKTAHETEDEVNEETYEAIRVAYLEIITSTLEKLRDEGDLRTAAGDRIWTWLHYADAYDEEIDNVTFARIQQDPALTERFALRYEDTGMSLTAVLKERFSVGHVHKA